MKSRLLILTKNKMETKKEIASRILEEVIVPIIKDISLSNYFKMREDIEAILSTIE